MQDEMTRDRGLIPQSGDADGVPRPVPIAAIGASAGGLEALQQLFESIAGDLPCAIVVLQHLSPEFKSLMVELLARHTRMPVHKAAPGVAPLAGCVYLNDANHNLTLEDGRFRLHDRDPQQNPNLPIDRFLRSLADAGPRPRLAMILSGTGSDGMRGAEVLKAGGGALFVQSPASARFDGMPVSTLSTGLVDFAGSPAELAERLSRWALDPLAPIQDESSAHSDEVRILALLRVITARFGIDFQSYKRATVHRRLARRIAATRCDGIEAYSEYFHSSPAEVEALKNELLISVTSFFRDPEVFELLARDVLPSVFDAHDSTRPLRIWVPACATGEEAYSLAMLLVETRERLGLHCELRVLATDVDPMGLRVGGAGQYSDAIREQVSPERLARFFKPIPGGYEVSSELRQMLLFAPHNLLEDPPFTSIRLVSCRNLLIYLDDHLQGRALAACRFSLADGGYLVLGMSEGVTSLADRFRPVEARLHVFEAIGPRTLGPDAALRLASKHSLADVHLRGRRNEDRFVQQIETQLRARFVPPAVVVSEGLRVMHVFGDVSPWIRVQPGQVDLGIATMAVRPLAALLSTGVGRALREGQEVSYPATVESDGLRRETIVRILPTELQLERQRLALVVFERVVQSVLEPTDGDSIPVDGDDAEAGSNSLRVAELQQELQLSRDNLQALIEELETSNEELQSTNEELTAANEELQSTNEELHAVNEELHTVNAEYGNKIVDLEQLHDDLNNILRCTEIGTLLLDERLTIRRFTPPLTRFLNLLVHDIGRPLDQLVLPLGGVAILEDARRVAGRHDATERRLTAPDGREVLVKTMPYLKDRSIHAGVVISFIDVTQMELADARVRRVLDGMPHQVALLDRRGEILATNRAWREFGLANGVTEDCISDIGSNYLRVCAEDTLPPDSEGHLVRREFRRLVEGEIDRFKIEYPCHAPDACRWFEMHAVSVDTSGEIVVSHIDITERKLNELAIRDQAILDPLTGVLNRRGLHEQLLAETERASRSGSYVSAMVIDLDDFKAINDAHGHATGDALLAAFARRLRDGVRPYDHVARIGGDEFVVLVPDVTPEDAGRAAERIRGSLSRVPFSIRGQSITQTATMSVVDVALDDASIEQILLASRTTLARSKASGKNRVRVAGIERDLAAPPGLLTAGIGLRVARQPIIDLRDERIVGYEFLSRGPLGFESPESLFRAAADADALIDFDLQCVRACAHAAHSNRGWRHLNLLPESLLGRGHRAVVDAIGVLSDGHHFCIELSEQQLMRMPPQLRDEALDLRRVGLRLAIDDVGFGRTSLEHLVLLEPDIVKIDRRFVQGVASRPGARRHLKRLVDMCHALSTTVIAEGIETREDAAVLVDLGLQHAQGFLWGQPEFAEPDAMQA